MPSKENRKLTNSGFMAYMNMGFTILITILACVLGGVFLDRYLAWKFPVFTLIGSLLGVTGGIWSIIRKL